MLYDSANRQSEPFRVKMIVLLGEVGGIEEYKIVDALKDGRITKPLVAWCIGTCADHITSEVSCEGIVFLAPNFFVSRYNLVMLVRQLMPPVKLPLQRTPH